MSELTWKKEEKMTMTDEQLLELARLSVDGEINRHSIDQFCQTYPDITEEEKKDSWKLSAASLKNWNSFWIP